MGLWRARTAVLWRARTAVLWRAWRAVLGESKDRGTPRTHREGHPWNRTGLGVPESSRECREVVLRSVRAAALTPSIGRVWQHNRLPAANEHSCQVAGTGDAESAQLCVF
eukprot:366412-Chlamydomonas_euryale.AAC.26